MKIKNEYVIIKNGKKQIKLHNLILDRYLNQIVTNQIDIENRKSLLMYYIFIKFDTELTFDNTTELNENSFDLAMWASSYDTEMTKKDIINNYMYKLEKGYSAIKISTNQEITNFEEYSGRKITAIGFGANTYSNLYACLDTSNYNIYLDTNQTFTVTRKDILSTDGYFYSQDSIVQSPIHLSNGIGVNDPVSGIYKDYYGVLKSVGLGINPYKMLEEHSLMPYINHIETGTDFINILDELVIEYISEGLFPAQDLYPAENLYPARIIEDSLYPSADIYPRYRYISYICTISIHTAKI